MPCTIKRAIVTVCALHEINFPFFTRNQCYHVNFVAKPSEFPLILFVSNTMRWDNLSTRLPFPRKHNVRHAGYQKATKWNRVFEISSALQAVRFSFPVQVLAKSRSSTMGPKFRRFSGEHSYSCRVLRIFSLHG